MAIADSTPTPKANGAARTEQGGQAPGNAVASAAKHATRARRAAKPRRPAVTAEKSSATAKQDNENAIRPARVRRKAPDEQRPTAVVPEDVPDDGTSAAVPEHIKERFVQVGRKFYFPNGDQAFRDRGARLTTQSENTEVIRSMLEIAQARGWERITVTGSERFRKEAWQQAKLAGLTARGYRPNEVEQAQLVRLMDRERTKDKESLRPSTPDAERDDQPLETPEPTVQSSARVPAAEPQVYRGRLLDHGAANYRHDRHADVSYFVKIDTPAGERTLWGRDLERALKTSLSQVKKGDEVALRLLGEKPVTVVRPTRDEAGRIVGKAEVAAYRNRWLVEKRDFLETRAQLARVVRDPSIDPKTATRQRPELVGTYLELRAAELVAKEVYADARDQQRFVTRVRDAIAAEIERGEPLSAVRVRESAQRRDPIVRNQQLSQARALS